MLIFLSHAELVSTGPVGVSLFLALSGFCMTVSYLDKPEKTPAPSIIHNFEFAWRKIKKLYPLHVATLLFVSAVIFAGLIHKGSTKEIIEQGLYFAANGMLLQSWIPWRDGYFSFNAVSWYLSASVFLYYIFPWVFPVIQSKDIRRIARLSGIVLGLMIAVALILGAGKQNWGWTSAFLKWVTYICPLYRAGDFIIGLAAGFFFLTQKRPQRGSVYTAAETGTILLISIQVLIYHKGILHATNWMLTLFWLPTSILCIYLFAVNKGVVSQILSKSKVLVWLGNISAEAFLLHQICIKAAEYLTKNKWIAAASALAMTLLAAEIWRWLYSRIKMRAIRDPGVNRKGDAQA